MSLRKQTLLLVGTALTLFLVGGLLMVRHIATGSWRRIDESRLTSGVARARLLLDERQGQLAVTLHDYASWDLLHAALASGDARTAAAQCSLAELRDTGVDCVLLTDARGAVVSAEADSTLYPDPRPLFAALGDLAAQAPRRAAGVPDWSEIGHLKLSETIVLAAAMPILRSDSTGDPQGVLVIGRALGPAFWQDLSRLVGVRFLAASAAASPDEMTAPFSLPGLDGAPPVEATLAVPRLYDAESQARLRSLLATALAAGALIIGGVVLLLERRLLRRLATMQRRVQAVFDAGDLAPCLETGYRDELGSLAKTINTTFESLAVHERALADSRRALTSMLDNLAGMAYSAVPIGEQLLLQFVSDGCARLTGRSATSILSEEMTDLADLAHDGQRAEMERRRREALARGEPYRLDYRLAHADGAEVWVFDQGRGVCDDAGTLIAVEGIMIDITERVRAEAALQEAHERLEERVAERTAALAESLSCLQQSEDELRAVIGATQDAMIAVDEQGCIRLFNPAAARLFGVAVDETLGEPLARLLPADQRANHEVRVRRLFAGAYPPEALASPRTIVYTRPSGERLTLEVSLSLVRRGQGNLALAVLRDVTEQNRLQMQLAQSQKLESIGRLAAGIAHEINTPTQYVADNTRFLQDAFADLQALLDACAGLAAAGRADETLPATLQAVKAAVDAADLDYLKTEIPQAIRQSLEGLDRIAGIVRAMKDFSHPGSDAPAPADLNRAIENTATVSRNEWKYVADLRLDLDPALPAVPCLLGEFNQALLNLITNAAHAIRDAGKGEHKGEIVIRTRRDGNLAVISVADTGHGIPAAIRDRIFDPFFTTKEVGKGTGQGLAIVRSVIVDKLRGDIDFESEVGRGTTFHLRLPLHAAADSAPETDGGESAALPAAAETAPAGGARPR